MDAIPELQFTSYLGVLFTREGVYRVAPDGKAEEFLPKVHIRSITVKRGFLSQNPLVQLVTGIGILLGCAFAIWNMLTVPHVINFGLIEAVIATLGMLFVGLWLIWGSKNRGIYFEVRTDHEKTKFPLNGKPDKGEFMIFLRDVAKLGFMVDSTSEMPVDW